MRIGVAVVDCCVVKSCEDADRVKLGVADCRLVADGCVVAATRGHGLVGIMGDGLLFACGYLNFGEDTRTRMG